VRIAEPKIEPETISVEGVQVAGVQVRRSRQKDRRTFVMVFDPGLIPIPRVLEMARETDRYLPVFAWRVARNFDCAISFGSSSPLWSVSSRSNSADAKSIHSFLDIFPF